MRERKKVGKKERECVGERVKRRCRTTKTYGENPVYIKANEIVLMPSALRMGVYIHDKVLSIDLSNMLI